MVSEILAIGVEWFKKGIFCCLVVEQLKKASLQSEERIKQLESRLQGLAVGAAPAVAAAPAAASKASDDDDGVDLFGSDSEDEDESAAKLREARLAEYANKKSKSNFNLIVFTEFLY